MPASKAISIGAANVPCSPPGEGSVATSAIRPSAVMPTPTHWRRGTVQPNSRSPRTATTITPVDSTACTMDSGASASAATCSTQAPAAIAIPTANHFERNRAFALDSGRRMSTTGAALAPRCLHRNASCVTTAHTSASAIPRLTIRRVFLRLA